MFLSLLGFTSGDMKTIAPCKTFVTISIVPISEPTYLPQQPPTQYSANSIYPPGQVMDDQSYSTGLAQDTIVKIDELRRLMKYPKYNMNPNGIIQWAIHCSFNGENTSYIESLA